MVRLKGTDDQNISGSGLSFQFQYGAIKRPLVKKSPAIETSFNSNMVRLKELLINLSGSYINRFNSNMVRLKGGRNPENPSDRTTFQFQYGAIKRH